MPINRCGLALCDLLTVVVRSGGRCAVAVPAGLATLVPSARTAIVLPGVDITAVVVTVPAMHGRAFVVFTTPLASFALPMFTRPVAVMLAAFLLPMTIVSVVIFRLRCCRNKTDGERQYRSGNQVRKFHTASKKRKLRA